jgi:hypothetical protein
MGDVFMIFSGCFQTELADLVIEHGIMEEWELTFIEDVSCCRPDRYGEYCSSCPFAIENAQNSTDWLTYL